MLYETKFYEIIDVCDHERLTQNQYKNNWQWIIDCPWRNVATHNIDRANDEIIYSK